MGKKTPFKIQEIMNNRDLAIRAANNEILELAQNAYPEGLEITVVSPWGIVDAEVICTFLDDHYGLVLGMRDKKHCNFHVLMPSHIHPKDRHHGEPSYLSDVRTWGVE